jgi:hypothetical protein
VAKAASSAKNRQILLTVDDGQSSAYKNIQQISFRKLKISQTKIIQPPGPRHLCPCSWSMLTDPPFLFSKRGPTCSILLDCDVMTE